MPGSNSSARDVRAPHPVAEPVTLTVHGLSAPDLADPVLAARRRTVQGRIKMLLVLAVCAAPVVASYLTYFVIRPQGSSTNYGTLIQPLRSMPALSLNTLDGATVAPSALRGQWLLVTVGPAACGPACEKRLLLQRQLREMLGRERARLDKVWFVTDAATLSAPLRASIEAPAGTPVKALRVDAAALAAWLQPDTGRALDDHLYVVDPMGEWMMRLPADPEPGRVKRDLERLMRASAWWDTPGRTPPKAP